jgi:hypothetical protein
METIMIDTESPELVGQIEALLLLADLLPLPTYSYLDELTADDYRHHLAKRQHRIRAKSFTNNEI